MGFKIGDIVMRLDGDKRPHKIVDVSVFYPLNHNEHTFFQWHYEDGGHDVDVGNLTLYDGKNQEFDTKGNRKNG